MPRLLRLNGHFLFPYPFLKKVGKYSDHENARSISRSKHPTDQGPLTTCPPTKICHDSPVLGHILEIGTFGRRNPLRGQGGGNIKLTLFSKFSLLFTHEQLKFSPLEGCLRPMKNLLEM